MIVMMMRPERILTLNLTRVTMYYCALYSLVSDRVGKITGKFIQGNQKTLKLILCLYRLLSPLIIMEI